MRVAAMLAAAAASPRTAGTQAALRFAQAEVARAFSDLASLQAQAQRLNSSLTKALRLIHGAYTHTLASSRCSARV